MNGHIDVVEYLVANSADTHSIQTYVNIEDNNNKTALMWATEKGHTEVVEYLKSKGAKE